MNIERSERIYQKKFAFLPKKLTNGRLIWLKKYYKVYRPWFDTEYDTVYLTIDDCIVFRLSNHS